MENNMKSAFKNNIAVSNDNSSPNSINSQHKAIPINVNPNHNLNTNSSFANMFSSSAPPTVTTNVNGIGSPYHNQLQQQYQLQQQQQYQQLLQRQQADLMQRQRPIVIAPSNQSSSAMRALQEQQRIFGNVQSDSIITQNPVQMISSSRNPTMLPAERQPQADYDFSQFIDYRQPTYDDNMFMMDSPSLLVDAPGNTSPYITDDIISAISGNTTIVGNNNLNNADDEELMGINPDDYIDTAGNSNEDLYLNDVSVSLPDERLIDMYKQHKLKASTSGNVNYNNSANLQQQQLQKLYEEELTRGIANTSTNDQKQTNTEAAIFSAPLSSTTTTTTVGTAGGAIRPRSRAGRSSSSLSQAFETGGSSETLNIVDTDINTHALLLEKQRRRRESHNAVERRRRDNINDRIQELSILVPDSGDSSGSGTRSAANKGTVLKKSIEYIRFLSQTNQNLREQIKSLETQLAQFKNSMNS